MNYEKDLMAHWDEYALKNTIEYDREKAREEGRNRGRKEGKIEEVRNLITKLGLSSEQIAEVAEVSVAFVEKIRRSLQ